MRAVVPAVYMYKGGDSRGLVSACAFPGSGQIIVTGAEPSDWEDQTQPYQPSQGRADAAESAARQAVLYLQHAESHDWMSKLPGAQNHLRLSDMRLMVEEGFASREGAKADLHIDLCGCYDCGASCGAAVALAVAQLARGVCLSRGVAAIGEVGPRGMLHPLRTPEEAIKCPGPNYPKVFIYPKHGDDGDIGKPAGPADLIMEGVSNIKEMLSYAFKL